MKITLKVIAEETGVGQMTVSRILRGLSGGQVSEHVRNRVVSSLTAHGYDFQKASRKSHARRSPAGKKVVCVIPYKNFFDQPPLGNSLNFYDAFEEYCRKNHIPYEYVVGLCANNPVIPAWETLNGIPAGTPVVFHTSYELTSAIALEQRGCRVALVLRDLFWRNFYAPQLKKMSCFTIKTAEGIAQAIRALRLAGCERIACGALVNYLAEPGYPVLAGYDYEQRINNASYRQVIPLPDYKEENFCTIIGEAYKNNPFDGIYIPTQVIEVCTDLRRKAGLPQSVKIASANISKKASKVSTVDYVLSFSYQEIMPDVFANLFANQFIPTERSYNCQLTGEKHE